MLRGILAFLGLLGSLALLTSVAEPARSSATFQPPEPVSRSFEFIYQVYFPPTENSHGSVLLWIPLPQSDGYQDLSALHIDSSVAYSKGRDPEYKGSLAVFKPTTWQAVAGFDLTLRFTATRREHKVVLNSNFKNDSTVLPAAPWFAVISRPTSSYL